MSPSHAPDPQTQRQRIIVQSSIYRMDGQQGPTVDHRELYSVSVINPNGKEYEKVYICV